MPGTRRTITQARGMGPLPGMVLEEHGERSLTALFRRHDLPMAVIDQRDACIPLADMVELFEDAAHLTGDPFFGLRVGRQMRVMDYGGHIRHAAAASTLGGGIERAIRGLRYYQGGAVTRLELSGDEACLSYRQLVASPERGRQHADHVLPAVLDFVRGFLGAAWQPDRYVVSYRRHGLGGRLETVLGGAVEFGRDGIGVVFDRALLATRTTPRASNGSSTLHELRRLVRDRSPDNLPDVVAKLVALQLLDGKIDLDAVAARLRLRPRTLQRQLATEGMSYSAIVDRVRFETACRLLRETRLTIGEIAFRLGYADHPHLTRAFRRMSGGSPAEFRRLGGGIGQ